MKKQVDLDKLEFDAIDIFNNGFACSESVIFAIRNNFEVEISDDAIAMSSGFPWGLNGGCICGALAGGTMCLGYFFGRRKPGDPNFKKCQKLTKELYDFFTDEFQVSCCRVLTKGFERNAPERKKHCEKMVTAVVRKTAEIIMRELDT